LKNVFTEKETHPMKKIDTRRLKNVLGRKFGFTRSNGGSTGHETWVDRHGRRIHPVMRHKSVSIASVYCTGLELEAHGVCSRIEFMRSVRG
jgi:hypothetical protein